MILEQFQSLAGQGYNRIPLMREVLADLDTPLSTYLKLAGAPYSYLFESVHGGEKWGRYSIIGLPARTLLSVRGNEVTVTTDHVVVEQETVDDPLAFIEAFQARYKVPEVEGLPKFTGGLVGYFGYDTVRYIEPRLAECPNPDMLDTPDILLMLSDEVVVFDNLSGKLHVIVHVDPSDPAALEKGETRLRQSGEGA
jgi:anthranilate synthase component 1